jgi:hypothetical protein
MNQRRFRRFIGPNGLYSSFINAFELFFYCIKQGLGLIQICLGNLIYLSDLSNHLFYFFSLFFNFHFLFLSFVLFYLNFFFLYLKSFCFFL